MLRSRAVYVLLLVAALAGICGFILDAESFVGNLLAEAWGVLVSVVLAFTLLDAWSRGQRRSDWQRVSYQTARSLHAHIMEIGYFCCVCQELLSNQILFDRENKFSFVAYSRASAMKASADVLRALSRLMREQIDQLCVVRKVPVNPAVVLDEWSRKEFATSERDRVSTRSIRRMVEPELIQIRNVLTPRVLQLADDPALAGILMDLEEREREWVENLKRVEGWGADEHPAWEALASVVDAAAAVVNHLADTGTAYAHPVNSRSTILARFFRQAPS